MRPPLLFNYTYMYCNNYYVVIRLYELVIKIHVINNNDEMMTTYMYMYNPMEPYNNPNPGNTSTCNVMYMSMDVQLIPVTMTN